MLMDENVVASLVRTNIKNLGFWKFQKQDQATVGIRRMTQCYTEGHDKLFDYYGRDVPAEAKWFVGYTATLLNPTTGEVFMQDYGRFTFLLKNLPRPHIRKQVFWGMDGHTDITRMGEEWSNFYGEEDPNEDAEIVEQVYRSLL
ncbi:hypothetical protein [Lewinella sp. W8]|uniref:hypothetical protein n=1 Tax=Lewinella sp. W8 TaxID=2528208 RepID=UPI001068970A|nr:hypothetical protein [Lewinella sp. W8]MTB53527.1 hypothetical protein [Lewinella sp. W8]